MSLDLPRAYAEIKASLQAGGRGLRRLSADEIMALEQSLKSTDPLIRHQAIMVAAHNSHSERDLEPTLIELMRSTLSAEDLVWLLNAARRHIIQGRLKDGDRLTHEFLEALKTLLHHKSGQVVEWTLRTVDECSAQGIVFRPELAKIKPSLWSIWNAQNRTILDLVTYLERKWSERETTNR